MAAVVPEGRIRGERQGGTNALALVCLRQFDRQQLVRHALWPAGRGSVMAFDSGKG